MDDKFLIEIQRCFRKLAGHLKTCNRDDRHATKCPCGFVQILNKCAYVTEACGCRGEINGSYDAMRTITPRPLVDIESVIADAVERAKNFRFDKEI